MSESNRMTTYFENNKIIAHIKPIVSVDKYGCIEKAVDISAIKCIVSALELLDKKVTKIILGSGTFLDFDAKYYRRYPEEVIEKVWNKISNWRYDGKEIFVKGNRLYVREGDYEIILPKKMYTDFDSKELHVYFYFE